MTTHNTVWTDDLLPHPPDAAPADPSAEVDVCVVGAGIAGLTTAYLLASEGVSVVVVDAGALGAGETGRTSAHLASALDDRFRVIERLHGGIAARLAAESHAAAIDRIESICVAEGIACAFQRVDGYLFQEDGGNERLREELAAAVRAGLQVEEVAAIPGAGWPGPALRFSRQAQFQPLLYLQGLAERCFAKGVRIMTHARVARITAGVRPGIEMADGGTISCSDVVVATNVPFNDRVMIQTKLEAYRSYVIAAEIPHDGAPRGLLWDDSDPYHYVRVHERPDEATDLLLVGGEDHKTGQGPSEPTLPYARLDAWMRERFPAAGRVAHAWSGQIIEPVDSLAYIGRNPGDEHVYLIAGDSGNGLTHGTIGGMVVCDLIRGRPNPWAELYRPSRITLGAAREYAGHNANVLRQYGDWLTSGDVASVDAIAPGSGAVVRDGLRKLAVHRDTEGRVHACSAVCPHLGGLVRWNATESTWDCPCHGSRFAPTGAVLNGPANTDLAVEHLRWGGGMVVPQSLGYA